MSDYTKNTNFATKDTLPSGNSGKIVKGTEIDTEFNAIASAITSKADKASPTFTGTPSAPTATTGSNTTQLANTAFVKTAVDALGTIGTMAAQDADDVAITGGTAVFNAVYGSVIVALPQSGTPGPLEGGQIELLGGPSYPSYNKQLDVLAENFRIFGDGNWDAQIFSTTGTAGLTVQGNITAGGNNVLTSANLKGLGLGGETWHDVTGSRAFGSTYTNNYSYPIMVSASSAASSNSYLSITVAGTEIYRNAAQWNGAGAYGGGAVIVPPGATYSITAASSLLFWRELY